MFKRLTFAVLVTAVAATSAHAEIAFVDEADIELAPVSAESDEPTDWTKPYAVMGRGVKERKTGRILQLACKTEPVRNEAGELRCAEVQFVEVDLSGNVAELGRPMRLGTDFESSKDFRRLLKDRVKNLKASGELPGREVFSSTKNWFSSGASPGTKAWPVILGAGLGGIALAGGAPILGVVGLTLFGAFPIGIDVILVPLGLGVGAIKGDYFVGNKTMSVYGWVRDRDPSHWQFKPRGLSAKNYARFKQIVTARPRRIQRVRWIGAEGGDGRRTDYVDVVHKDGRAETILRPSNLVLISKQERRVYDENGRVTID